MCQDISEIAGAPVCHGKFVRLNLVVKIFTGINFRAIIRLKKKVFCPCVVWIVLNGKPYCFVSGRGLRFRFLDFQLIVLSGLYVTPKG